jgi:hypothetical protein
MGWLCHWTGGLKVTWGWDLSLKGQAKSLSDCSLAYIPINNCAFCEPFQKNLWESVNCTCAIKVSVESLEVILLLNVEGQSVNNYHGKTGIPSIKFATCEQYSQELRDIYVTISDAQKLSTSKCRGNSPECTDSTAASVVSQRLHHLFAQWVHNFLEISIVFQLW